MTDQVAHVSLDEEFEGDPEYMLFRTVDRIVDQICHAMEEEGVSQSELARRLDVSRQHISSFLADPGNPTMQTVVQMAHALGLTINVELRRRRAHITADTQGHGYS
ncbi:MAG: helix-turn-helix transcriptional regulator [Armatimonadota bacterium]|nr:helix-turn-helix transcriptional regulator [Armatimonadota bacterium]